METFIKGVCFGIILSILALNTGCGRGPNHIDPAFQPTYDRFIDDAKSNGKDLDKDQGQTIEFGDLTSEGLAGECLDYNHIVIDKTYWGGFDDTTRMLLVYHELGHCVLRKDHSESRDEIMYPYVRFNLLPSMLSDFFDGADNATHQ